MCIMIYNIQIVMVLSYLILLILTCCCWSIIMVEIIPWMNWLVSAKSYFFSLSCHALLLIFIMVEIIWWTNWLVSAKSRFFSFCIVTRHVWTWRTMFWGLFMDYFCSSEYTAHVTIAYINNMLRDDLTSVLVSFVVVKQTVSQLCTTVSQLDYF